MIKELKSVPPVELKHLHQNYDETGMGFVVAKTVEGIEIVLSEQFIIPCNSLQFYSIDDYLKGVPLPTQSVTQNLNVLSTFSNRQSALPTLRTQVQIPSSWPGTTGKYPLIGHTTLPARTRVYRNLTSPLDHRFDGTKLKGYTDLMVDGAPLPHQPDTIIRWLIDRPRS